VTAEEQHRAGVWRRFADRRGRVQCYATMVGVPHDCRGKIQADHVLERQRLRRRARELGVPEDKLIADDRNGVPLCEVLNGSPRRREILRQAGVPVQVMQFAIEWGLEWDLERDYGVRLRA